MKNAGFVPRFLLAEQFVLAFTVVLFLALLPVTPALATKNGLLNIFGYALPLMIVATGMTVVVITGGIDLSVTSIIAVTSVAGATLVSSDLRGLPTGAGVAAMLAVGAALGSVNGAMVTLLRIPPFIATLASMMFISGFAIWWTQSKTIYQLPSAFLAIGKQLPVAAAITLLIGCSAHLFLRHTLFGRWVYAIGQNAVAAHISGVPVKAMTFVAYVFSGLCAACASVILTARLETGSPILGREILLDVIGATIIGGTSLAGGKGKILWTVFGVLFLAILDNALNMLNFSHFAITMTKGAVILFAATLDAIRQRVTGQA